MSPRRVLLTDHARVQASRRGLDQETVLGVVEAPEQVVRVREGREVRPSRVPSGSRGKMFLVRVVVDLRAGEAHVVTAYRTKKIDKYWRKT
ncbi:MAG: DUF4258 domain-containing protein [Planctomycetota bacterium]